jgi:hypothetical protein
MNLQLVLISFLVFVAVVVGMAVGVIFSNRRLKGSCGGLSAWRDELGDPMCDACAECPEKKSECELRDLEDETSAIGHAEPVQVERIEHLRP